jgi:hypothetical protein
MASKAKTLLSSSTMIRAKTRTLHRIIRRRWRRAIRWRRLAMPSKSVIIIIIII